MHNVLRPTEEKRPGLVVAVGGFHLPSTSLYQNNPLGNKGVKRGVFGYISPLPLFFLLLIVSIGLVGCGNNDDKEMKQSDYKETYNSLVGAGSSVCRSRGMEYSSIYMSDFENWRVVCYTKSPVKHYEFGVSLSD